MLSRGFSLKVPFKENFCFTLLIAKNTSGPTDPFIICTLIHRNYTLRN